MEEYVPGSYFKKMNTGNVETFFRLTDEMNFEVFNITERKWMINNDYAKIFIGKIDYEFATEEEFEYWAREVGDME